MKSRLSLAFQSFDWNILYIFPSLIFTSLFLSEFVISVFSTVKWLIWSSEDYKIFIRSNLSECKTSVDKNKLNVVLTNRLNSKFKKKFQNIKHTCYWGENHCISFHKNSHFEKIDRIQLLNSFRLYLQNHFSHPFQNSCIIYPFHQLGFLHVFFFLLTPLA